MTPAEARLMIDSRPRPRDRRLLELLWRTAGRISEVLSIRVADLSPSGIRLRNLKQGEWTTDAAGLPVYRSIAAEKFVYVAAEVMDQLRAEMAGLPLHALVVAHLDTQGGLTRQRAEQLVMQAALECGVMKQRRVGGPLRPASPHLFRHGAAVNLLRQGIPITAVQAHLGHSSLRSTQRYTQLADRELQRYITSAEF